MSNLLPSSYQRVEYIKSHSPGQNYGNQYIDTGIIPTQYTNIEGYIKFAGMFYCSNKYQTISNIFGSRDNDPNINHVFTINFGGQSNQANVIFIWNDKPYNTEGDNSVKEIREIDPYKKSYIKLKDNIFYYDEKSINTHNRRERNSHNSILLFGLKINGECRGFSAYEEMYLYSFKIYEGEQIVRDYIPVLRKTDNIAGLYDLVDNKFYKSDGPEDFIAGPEVTEINTPEVDWTKSMEQTFEYYEVDPNTWKDLKPLQMVKSCSIKRDDGTDTLGSATIDINDTLGECYVRVYLIVRQNGGTFKFTLGTFLVQTPSSSYDGKNRNVSMDCYTPLLELKENPPPLGYALLKNDNIMREAYLIIRDNCRAPVVETTADNTLLDNFVADPSENWLHYISDLIDQAKYKLYLDEEGRILFAPKQKIDELKPVWIYNDDNSSILYPEVSMQHDLYGIPNVVEVVCSTGTHEYTARVVNDDPNSPTSTVNRGREILHRDTEPNLPGFPTEDQIDEYAKNLLESLSSVEYEISYTHGYCPVRVGDAVRLNYKKAGLEGIKAKVISQSIKCENGCSVSETAVFTKKLWN